MSNLAARQHGVLELFDSVRTQPLPFLLDSAAGEGPSYLGADPRLVLTAKGGHVSWWEGGRERSWDGNPFDALEELLRRKAGLAVGWLGYDLGSFLETLPGRAVDDLQFPDLHFAVYDDWSEAREGEVRRHHGQGARARAELRLPPSRPIVHRTFTQPAYLDAIRRAKEYIAAGDIYQVNLSQRFEVSATEPLATYVRLRQASPAPYAAYFQTGDRAILSSSPELFLNVRGRRIITRPIKGTRPPGLDRELLESPKDDAELAMIVDLERNDLGRVCEYGSVRVEAPKVLENHATVHHLSATIAGVLRDGVGPVDVLRATFPGGSVTGAPKIRAMEIIDELEPTRRGVYTGAFGFIEPDGDLNLAVAIRMLHYDRGRFSFQVGGAIVADSDPEEEYRETLVKAAGMARALEMEWNTSP